MKAVLALLISAGMSTAAMAAPVSPATEFSGSVWNGQTQLGHLQLATAPDRPGVVFFGSGLSVELTSHQDGSSVVRLLDSAGKPLHTANTPPGANPSKSFRYVVCGTQVTFSSPEPADVPAACPAS